jgi:transposase
VLINLERRQPVALLPDRTAETLAHWLREHPGVEVSARDRSQAYADGAHQGAPAAIQVADRFHLLQNLAEALDQVFTTHSQVLDAVNAAWRQHPVPLSDGTVAVPVPPPSMPTPAQQRAAQRQARRQTAYEQVWALHRHGWTVSAMAPQVGMSPRTVERDLRTATFPGRQQRSDRGHSLLDPYKTALLGRWNAGCRTAMRLCRDLQRRGYAGSYGLVAAYARRLPQAQGLAPGQRRARQLLPVVAEARYRPLTPRRATWLVLRREEQRTAAEAEQLARLRAQQAEVDEAMTLAQDCATLVRQRQPAEARDHQSAGGLAALCHRALRGRRRRQSRCDPPMEYGPCRGAHQPPQTAQAPKVWASAPRSLEPPLRTRTSMWAGAFPARGSGRLITGVEQGIAGYHD